MSQSRTNTHITEVANRVMNHGGEVRPKRSAAGVVEVRNLASLAVLEDLEMEAIDKGRSTTIAEGVLIELRVVLAYSSRLRHDSDGSVSDCVGRGKHDCDGTEGEHGDGRHCEE